MLNLESLTLVTRFQRDVLGSDRVADQQVKDDWFLVLWTGRREVEIKIVSLG